MTKQLAKKLLVVLGDQLTPTLAGLQAADKASAVVLMMEVQAEGTYVPHHPQKIALILSAMRHFADELRNLGWTVDYVPLDAPENTQSFKGEVQRAVHRHGATEVLVTWPGEWRVLEDMRTWEAAVGVPVNIVEDDRWVMSRAWFAQWMQGRKQPRMEHFYREVRRMTGLLMDGDQPVGGAWNFDHDNRAGPPVGGLLPLPVRPAETLDATDEAVLVLVAARFGHHFGHLRPFGWATTRVGAEARLQNFLREGLPWFGTYQDAMLEEHDTLFHSLLSPYLNLGLLDPLAVCRAVEAEYVAGRAPLNAVEGFIRQIIGWREFVRGIYWHQMPDYGTRNALGAVQPLPKFFWDPDATHMACVRAAVRNTRDHAYAHHIQRLMVTGNLALLAGLDVQAVCEWYLSVYIDAFEWVELPNTLGMALHGDGGLVGSKPYAASGKYIQRMSNHCQGCRFDPAVSAGPKACPFNVLYWDFLLRHEEKFRANGRMGPAMANVARLDDARRAEVRREAAGIVGGWENA